MNAIMDALKDYGVEHMDMPATPHRIWQRDPGRKAGELRRDSTCDTEPAITARVTLTRRTGGPIMPQRVMLQILTLTPHNGGRDEYPGRPRRARREQEEASSAAPICATPGTCAAWSDDLGDGGVLGRTILKEPVVVYREGNGEVVGAGGPLPAPLRAAQHGQGDRRQPHPVPLSRARIRHAPAPACSIRTATRTSRRARG